MKITINHFLISLFSLIVLIGCAQEQKLSMLLYGDRIVAFGDSLTYGTGVEPSQSYPAVLEKISGFDVVNAGVPGEESAQGLKRLTGVLATEQPRLVILCHGGNDLLRKRSREKLKTNLIKMIDIIRASGAEVVLLGVPRPGIFLSSENLYDEIAEQMDVAVELEIIPQLESDKTMKSDTVHFNRQGYAAMADAVFALLTQQGAITETR